LRSIGENSCKSLAYTEADIIKHIVPLRNGADLVMGNRFKGTMEHDAMPWLHRRIGTPFLTAVLNALFGTSISDINCGMRGFSKEAAGKMRLMRPGMEFAAEMIIKAAALGFRIEEIPVRYKASVPKRKPHVRTFRDGWRHLRFMLASFPRYGIRRYGASGAPQ
jgi:hypothetical protein